MAGETEATRVRADELANRLSELGLELTRTRIELEHSRAALAEMRRLMRTGTITRTLGQLNLRLRQRLGSPLKCETCDCPLVFPGEMESRQCEICRQFDWLAT